MRVEFRKSSKITIYHSSILIVIQIYDTDGNHRLNIQEAQNLADLRYDIEPSDATIAFEDVSHRSDHTVHL